MADARLAAVGGAVGICALIGLAIGLWIPRFPATTLQALFVMLCGLTLGAIAGATLRSRGSMLIAPLVSSVSFHIGRVISGMHGPTIDRVQLDTAYGVVAFALGFIVPGALALLPMLLGASIGAALARRPKVRAGPTSGRAWLFGVTLIAVSWRLRSHAQRLATAQPGGRLAIP